MFSDLNAKLAQLYNEADSRKSLDIAIELANEVIKILSPSANGLTYGEDALDNAMPASKFPNHKIESWFAGHPYFADDRVAIKFFENDLVETHFYWLSESATKSRIAAGTAITPNWEDSELNQKDDSYKVGLDIFLSYDTKSLLIVATSKNNLRVLELEGKLSNTQIDIFNTIRGAFDLPVRAQIHQTIWDSLALNEVNKKFYAGIAEHFTLLIQHLGTNNYDKEDAKLFASRLLGRLLFVWFLRKKHIIDESFGYFEAEGAGSTEYYETRLKKLFFETLNTPQSERDKLSKEQQKRLFDDTNDDTQTTLLKVDRTTPYLNGGLFEAHDNDWADRTVSFPKGYFKSLFEHLEQYNFTTDESSPEYEQVAIDPEMLGRVFESLLATQLTETGDQARKAKGAFYTPREIVSYMSRESLRQYLYTKLDNPAWNEGVDKLLDTSDSDWELSHSNSKRNLWGEANRNTVPQMVITALDDLKVLDPACGSGAYPMGMLQIILKTYERLESRFDPYTTKLRIIEENIYGVDIEPMAVEISRLRAWLSIVVDSNKNPSDFKPLPNLDFKFVVANSLLPLSKDFQFGDDKFDKVRSKMQWVIGKYFNTTDKQEKANLRTEFNKQSAQLSQTSLLDRETVLQKQLNSFKPFDVHSEAIFFDAKLMFGLKSKSPFDIVIGNPPYISALAAKRTIDPDTRQEYKNLYASAKGAYDMYLLFFERGVNLLSNKGTLSYISPTKYVSAKYAESFRSLLGDAYVLKLADFSNTKVFESAGVSTLVTFLNEDRNRTDVITEKYTNSSRDSVKLIESPKKSLTEFPENLWGHLIAGNYPLLSKIYSNSDTLSRLTEVNGSSTANEGDRFSNYVVDYDAPNSLRMVNTGNISTFRALWGEKEYSNKRKKIIKPYILLEDINERRINMYKSQKIIISKLSKRLTAMIDIDGLYASTNTTFVYNPKTNLDLIALTGLLNSKLMDFVYKTSYSGLNLLGSYQYQAPQIRLLPIHKDFVRQDGIVNELRDLVLEIRGLKQDEPRFKELNTKIDTIIYQLYDLTPEEIQIIEK